MNFHDPELGHFNFLLVLELQAGQRDKSGFGEPCGMSRIHTWPHLVLLTALSEINSSSCQPTVRSHSLQQPQPPELICPFLCSTQPGILLCKLFLLPCLPLPSAKAWLSKKLLLPSTQFLDWTRCPCEPLAAISWTQIPLCPAILMISLPRTHLDIFLKEQLGLLNMARMTKSL